MVMGLAGAAHAAVAQLAPATPDPEGPRLLAQRQAVLQKLTPVADEQGAVMRVFELPSR